MNSAVSISNKDRSARLVRFGLTGLVVCGVDYLALWLLQWVLPAILAVSGAYLTAVSLHFALSRQWVFESRDPNLMRQMVRYVACVVACWACTVGVFSASMALITTNIYVAKFITIPPTTLLGFCLMRFWVFRDRAH